MDQTSLNILQQNVTGVDSTENPLDRDARFTVALSVLLILCIALAYQIKDKKLYTIPESAATILVGSIAALIMNLLGKDSSSYLAALPDISFYLLLPLIVFEAGYCFECNDFLQNLLPIVMYATLETITSTFIVGFSIYHSAKLGLISYGIDKTNPMESLLFGALISATDSVATLSILGNPDLLVDDNLFTIVFGESVLNDPVAIVLFDTFRVTYNENISNLHFQNIFACLQRFTYVTVFSMLVGLVMGLIQSYIYKHSNLSNYQKIEVAMLFLFFYFNYSAAKVLSLSGIMALFINGIVVSHYNSFNLSEESRTTSEQIFSTLAYLAEQLLFLCMGLYACSGLLIHYWNMQFSLCALLFCLISRAVGISVLTRITNYFRSKAQQITLPMQVVIWWVGLRGACAFGLALNMPGPNSNSYAAVTLSICIFTTFVGGGLTEVILNKMKMKRLEGELKEEESSTLLHRTKSSKSVHSMSYGILSHLKSKSLVRNIDVVENENAEYSWQSLDRKYFRPLFGGDERY